MALGSGAGAVMSSESQLQPQNPACPGDGRGSGTPGLFEVGQLQQWPFGLVPPSFPALAASSVLVLARNGGGEREPRVGCVCVWGGVMQGALDR